MEGPSNLGSQRSPSDAPMGLCYTRVWNVQKGQMAAPLHGLDLLLLKHSEGSLTGKQVLAAATARFSAAQLKDDGCGAAVRAVCALNLYARQEPLLRWVRTQSLTSLVGS